MPARKILLFPVVLGLTLSAAAQFKKGDKMAGASVASLVLNSGHSDITVENIGSNTSKVTGHNISINPMLGWFLSDKTVAGLTLHINPNGEKTTYEQNGSAYQRDQVTNFNIGAGGFARSYLASSGNLMPFGQVSLNGGLNSLKQEGYFYYSTGIPYYKYTYDGSSDGGFFVNAAFTAGATRMLGENAGLDFYIGYTYSYSKNTFKKTTLYYLTANDNSPSRGENNTTTKFTNHGFSAGIAFQVFLHPKK